MRAFGKLLCKSLVVGNIIMFLYFRKKLIMINEKKEIRVISDLELKDASGGFVGVVVMSVLGLLVLAGCFLTPPNRRS